MIYIQPIRNFPKVDQWTEGEPFYPWGFACTQDEINKQARGKADQRVGDHQVPSDSLYWPQSRHETTRKQTGRQDKNRWKPGEQHIKSVKPDDDAENDGFEMCDRQDPYRWVRRSKKVDERCPDDNQYSS